MLIDSMLAPSCPLTNDPEVAPACATRLVLRDCLARREREAKFGLCDTGRYRCRYVIWGCGPALVMIPGLASNATCFAMLMARLQSDFCCISYDLPDGAKDGASLLKYRHADLAADLFALLDQLRIRECFLHGSSFGSTIALRALHEQQARFSRALLQGGFAYRPLALSEILLASFVRHLPGRFGNFPLVKKIQEMNHRAPFLQREPDVWDFFMAQIGQTPLRAVATRALMLSQLDLRPTLPSIRQPILIVCGDRDPLVGKACEHQLQQALPNVARAEIEDCGHEPHWTHPEVFAEVVRQFLMPMRS
jgi:pimeloyl-ACP methyl ester carboxylesterase